jgi:uncharacterized protein YyaL (SSP411 family)
MLYDNAQLARVYLHAWQVTGNEFFRAIAEEILDYVVREMTDPAGGFYSTQDADSEGEEGKFFVWTPDEIRDVLGDEADAFMAAYGVTRHGNFEGKNILEFVGDMEQRPDLADARRKLYEAREQRIHPGLDDKVITSWNGLMLAAFAEAARILDRDDYAQVAERNAEFLLGDLRQENGRLHRTWKRRPEHAEGAGEAKLNGYLEDYSYLIEGLLELYQTTFDPRWFVAARELAGLTNEFRYVDIAHQALVQMQPMMSQYPLGFGQWLQALAYTLSKPREIAIVGDPGSADTNALLGVVRDGYRPFQVVALGAPGAQPPVLPLLQDRGLVDGHAAAYVCRDFACQAPVTDPLSLKQLLSLN